LLELAPEEFEKIYKELKRLAAIHLRSEAPGHTLQPTALVHEALLRMKGIAHGIEEPKQLFKLASLMMRRILIDHARAKKSRRNNEALSLELPAIAHPALEVFSTEELLALNHALDELERLDARQAQIVEMRFFGGLSMLQIAAVLQLHIRQVQREWACARAWLLTRMSCS
jgi:RNA polymerase sigma factor (TIGR02999 family)